MVNAREPVWSEGMDAEDLFRLDTQGDDVDATCGKLRVVLADARFAPADRRRDEFLAGLRLLRDHLRDLEVPDDATLAGRIEALMARPRPSMPEQSRCAMRNDFMGLDVVEDPPSYYWVDPALILQSSPGRTSFIHDNSDRPGRGIDRVTGVCHLARRIAAERGDPRGLSRLLGDLDPDQGLAHIDVEGWQTPAGAWFRVNVNGNHRAAALAMLGVPCVLARVRWRWGPFDVDPGELDRVLDGKARVRGAVNRYRTLLQTYGVATFTDARCGLGNFQSVVTAWPFLIEGPKQAVASLEAVERLHGRRYGGRVGELPRDLFASAARVRRAAARNARLLGGFVRLLDARAFLQGETG